MRRERFACASPKLRLACIFNNFIKLLAARSGEVARRLRRSQLRLPNPAAASLSAKAHPLLAINAYVIDGTTTRHKTYSTEFEVHYPWHPWFGLKVTINRSCPRQGVVCVQVTLKQEGRLQSLEMPGWMFDRAACAAMSLAGHPAVGIKHLGCVAKMCWDTKILNVTSVQATTLKRSATNLTCPRMSPFPIPSTCPFRIMFMISYPPMVRRAVLILKKPSPGLTRRFMNR